LGAVVRLNERADSLRNVRGSEIAAGADAEVVIDGDTVCESDGVTILALGVDEPLCVAVRLPVSDPEPVDDGVEVVLGDMVDENDGVPVLERVALGVPDALSIWLRVKDCDGVAEPLSVPLPDSVFTCDVVPECDGVCVELALGVGSAELL
jgi:hypothetical protein